MARSQSDAGGRPPNVVFVLTDDQGYGDLACHGNPYLKTPHLDALYARSVRLTNYHVGPTCSPTRAGLLTGHYANSTGVWHTIAGRSLLRRGERTMAEYFGAAGYVTGLFGKWHLGDAYPYRPQDRGFQEVVTHGGGGVGNTPDHWGNNYLDDHYCRNGAWEPFRGYCTEVWFALATEFIERHRERPLFCLISTNAPHAPHIVPERYSRPYRELAQSDPRAAAAMEYPRSEEMIDFYGMVSCIDEQVGALRARLAALGLAEQTIFIFMTDNGSAGGLVTDRERFVRAGYNAGMRGGKGTPYEGGHRVPFFLHWPGGGFDQERDVTQLTANVDILPTLLELCGAGARPGDAFHGRSLVPLLRGQAEGWPARAIVTDSQRLLRPLKWRLSCVMRDSWRLINGRLLYDLASDPEQRHDVSAAHPEVVARLRADYESWWELVSPAGEAPSPIAIGDGAAGAVCLTAHDWRREPDRQREPAIGPEEYGDDARCVWNQAQVRQGPEQSGYWELEVQRAGWYRFELRRWPREAARPLQAGIPGPLPRYDRTIAAGYGGGRAIPIERAALRIAGVEASRAVGPADTAAVFELELAAGAARLETAFTNAAGLDLGAYYVYVEYLR